MGQKASLTRVGHDWSDLVAVVVVRVAEMLADTAPSGGEAPCSALVAAMGGRAKVLHSVSPGRDETWVTLSGVCLSYDKSQQS